MDRDFEMNNEEAGRLLKQLRRVAMASISFCFLYSSLRDLERDPNKSFSRVVAFTSVCYVVFQLLDAFARSVVFDLISVFFGIATLVIALLAATHILTFTFFN